MDITKVPIPSPGALQRMGMTSYDLTPPALYLHDKATPMMKMLTFSILAPVMSLLAGAESFTLPADHSTWFPFQPTGTEGSVIGMGDWMSSPKKFLVSDKDSLLKDGKPIKVWGTNVEYTSNAPEKANAEKAAAFFAAYGVNGVRLHKLTNPGWEGLGSETSAATYDPDKLDRFDYFTQQLRTRGIMYGLSPIWDLKIFSGDRGSLLAYDELKKTGTTKGVVWFARDVQDLHIQTFLNLLQHTNPYSGLRYANDPSVSYIEIQNEEDVFFFGITDALVRCPTYHALAAKRFSEWLGKRYGDQAALTQAWGAGLDSFSAKEGGFPGESLSKGNITPIGNPWMWDNQGKSGPRAKRLQDTALFLLECQDEYYDRVAKAIRKAGYGGPLVGSNWQAGASTGHLLNIVSDRKAGMIDRHNYQGGAQGGGNWDMRDGFGLANVTMLTDPGSMLMSVGMQQVVDRPFIFSEWAAVAPSEWAAADTTIIAAYGFGLQDWDMSYHFASNSPGFTATVNDGPKKFNNLTPLGFGLYPVLSRMVLRGDVRPGEVVAKRNYTVDQAVEQTTDFSITAQQNHDEKAFGGSVPNAALAMGRVLLDIENKSTPSNIDDLTAYRNGDAISSTTGELTWQVPAGKGPRGNITINTKGTQGVVGFAQGKVCELADCTITSAAPYAVILATALNQKGTLATDNQVLIAVIARVHNTGMELTADKIIRVGTAPMIIEPVKAEVTFKRKRGMVKVLDHSGQPTEQEYALDNGHVQVDTGRDRALYYLVTFR